MRVLELYPDAKAEIEAALGDDFVRRLQAAREALKEAVERVDGSSPRSV